MPRWCESSRKQSVVSNVIEVSGHPRDMGLAQGRALRTAVGEVVAAEGLPGKRSRWPALSAFSSGRVLGRGAGRELIRHYTHLSERIDGLAREALVPVASVMQLHVGRSVGRRNDTQVAGGAVALAGRDLGDPAALTMARTIPAPPTDLGDWLVRRSRPAVGFVSIEVTLPWLASAVVGVNEAGLCASYVADGEVEGVYAAPTFLLMVQECLQRFEDVEAACDWCDSRPASGRGTLLVCDASGDLAAVTISGRQVSARRADESGLLLAGPDAPEASTIGEDRRRPAEALLGVEAPAVVSILPVSRTLTLKVSKPEPSSVTLQP